MVNAPGMVTRGLVYLDVSDAALARLDAYEGECYVRVPVAAEGEDGGVIGAEVYLMRSEYRWMVLPERWEVRTDAGG